MRRWLLLLTVGMALVGARIYNGKSRHERQAPDEFEKCGIVLKEIAVLQPVNSDREQFILKRILIEKDTGKPASGPCAEALQASIDKEDAGKSPYEPPERIDGGVEPKRENNVIAELPYMSAPKSKREHQPGEYKEIDYEMAPDVELPALVEPPRGDLSVQLDNSVPQIQPKRPEVDFQTHHGYRKGKKCSYGKKEPTIEESRSPRKCLRRDIPRPPLPPAVLPWCNTEKPWLNTAPCRMPTPAPEYKEFVRPLDERVEIKTPQRKRCLHQPRQQPAPFPETKVQPPRRAGRCRNTDKSRRLPPNGNGHHNHLHHNSHNNELKPLDPVYDNRENSVNQPEPMIEMEDRKKREHLQLIPALPVYRI